MNHSTVERDGERPNCLCRNCIEVRHRRRIIRDSFLLRDWDSRDQTTLSSPAGLQAGDEVYVGTYKGTVLPSASTFISITAPSSFVWGAGKQSSVEEAAHHLPPKALLAICKTLHDGAAKYEPERLSEFGGENWRRISKADHYNHAMLHLVKWLSGDRTEDHLSHATARLLFLKELELET